MLFFESHEGALEGRIEPGTYLYILGSADESALWGTVRITGAPDIIPLDWHGSLVPPNHLCQESGSLFVETIGGQDLTGALPRESRRIRLTDGRLTWVPYSWTYLCE